MRYLPDPNDPDVAAFRAELDKRRQRGDTFQAAPTKHQKPLWDRREEGLRFYMSVRNRTRSAYGYREVYD